MATKTTKPKKSTAPDSTATLLGAAVDLVEASNKAAMASGNAEVEAMQLLIRIAPVTMDNVNAMTALAKKVEAAATLRNKVVDANMKMVKAMRRHLNEIR